jgi:hypothetical protein
MGVLRAGRAEGVSMSTMGVFAISATPTACGYSDGKHAVYNPLVQLSFRKSLFPSLLRLILNLHRSHVVRTLLLLKVKLFTLAGRVVEQIKSLLCQISRHLLLLGPHR